MTRLLLLLLLMGPALAQDPSPSATPDPDAAAARQLAELEAERRQLDAQLRGTGTIQASASGSIEEELPRLAKAAEATPTADALVAHAVALAGAGRFPEAQAQARRAAAADPKHEPAAVTARELARFDGKNGNAVLAALLAARRVLERREEVAEARRSLPAIAARLAAQPAPEVLLEQAAAFVVLDEHAPALEAARKVLALDSKNAVAGMLVEELTRPDARDPEAVRTAITVRWMRLNAAAASR